MKMILGLVVLCFAVAAEAKLRIVGGSNAPDGKYPYMASVWMPIAQSSLYLCGASVINERWILTSASCLHGKEDIDLNIVVGTNLMDSSAGKVYHSEHVIRHANYNIFDKLNDIGLIRVDRDIVFDDKVQPISLPTSDSTKANDIAVLTGWGQTEKNGPNPMLLQEINLKLISHFTCARKLWLAQISINEKSHICTFTKAGEGVCYGDSGNPLVVNGVQVGIASIARSCARGSPDVYTKVSSYVDWIHEQMNKY